MGKFLSAKAVISPCFFKSIPAALYVPERSKGRLAQSLQKMLAPDSNPGSVLQLQKSNEKQILFICLTIIHNWHFTLRSNFTLFLSALVTKACWYSAYARLVDELQSGQVCWIMLEFCSKRIIIDVKLQLPFLRWNQWSSAESRRWIVVMQQNCFLEKIFSTRVHTALQRPKESQNKFCTPVSGIKHLRAKLMFFIKLYFCIR